MKYCLCTGKDGEEKTERLTKEMHKIDNIIEKRENNISFNLPSDFTPDIPPDDHICVLERCEVLLDELMSRGFHINIHPDIPLKARYLYAQHVALLTEGLFLKEPGIANIVFTGCTGFCEECFQQRWCPLDDEDDDIEIDY